MKFRILFLLYIIVIFAVLECVQGQRHRGQLKDEVIIEEQEQFENPGRRFPSRESTRRHNPNVKSRSQNVRNIQKSESEETIPEQTPGKNLEAQDIRNQARKNLEDQRIIEQLFRDNLVNAFAQARTINRQPEIQERVKQPEQIVSDEVDSKTRNPERLRNSVANERNINRREGLSRSIPITQDNARNSDEEAVINIESRFDTDRAHADQIIPENTAHTVQSSRPTNVRRTPKNSEAIENPVTSDRGTKRGAKQTITQQIVAVSIPKDESYSINSFQAENTVRKNPSVYIEETTVNKPNEKRIISQNLGSIVRATQRVKPTQAEEIKHNVEEDLVKSFDALKANQRRKPAAQVEKQVVTAAPVVHTTPKVQQRKEHIQIQEITEAEVAKHVRPTTERRKQHIEQIKMTRPTALKTNIETVVVPISPTPTHRSKIQTPIVQDTNKATNFQHIKNFNELPPEIQQFHLQYLTNKNKKPEIVHHEIQKEEIHPTERTKIPSRFREAAPKTPKPHIIENTRSSLEVTIKDQNPSPSRHSVTIEQPIENRHHAHHEIKKVSETPQTRFSTTSLKDPQEKLNLQFGESNEHVLIPTRLSTSSHRISSIPQVDSVEHKEIHLRNRQPIKTATRNSETENRHRPPQVEAEKPVIRVSEVPQTRFSTTSLKDPQEKLNLKYEETIEQVLIPTRLSTSTHRISSRPPIESEHNLQNRQPIKIATKNSGTENRHRTPQVETERPIIKVSEAPQTRFSTTSLKDPQEKLNLQFEESNEQVLIPTRLSTSTHRISSRPPIESVEQKEFNLQNRQPIKIASRNSGMANKHHTHQVEIEKPIIKVSEAPQTRFSTTSLKDPQEKLNLEYLESNEKVLIPTRLSTSTHRISSRPQIDSVEHLQNRQPIKIATRNSGTENRHHTQQLEAEIPVIIVEEPVRIVQQVSKVPQTRFSTTSLKDPEEQLHLRFENPNDEVIVTAEQKADYQTKPREIEEIKYDAQAHNSHLVTLLHAFAQQTLTETEYKNIKKPKSDSSIESDTDNSSSDSETDNSSSELSSSDESSSSEDEKTTPKPTPHDPTTTKRGRSHFNAEELKHHIRLRREAADLKETDRKVLLERQKLTLRTNRGYRRLQMKKLKSSGEEKTEVVNEVPVVTVKPLHQITERRNRGSTVFKKEELQYLNAGQSVDIPLSTEKDIEAEKMPKFESLRTTPKSRKIHSSTTTENTVTATEATVENTKKLKTRTFIRPFVRKQSKRLPLN